MGKASRWFRSFLGLKKHDQSPPAPSEPKEKRRWSLVKPSHKDKTTLHPPAVGSGSYADDPNKHAIAVAAATAAVAEAAVAAAQAAAAVVRLTSSGRCNSTAAYVSAGSSPPDELAAVKIQSAFRAYLARRALRALKGLVKLQALVRGHIVRRQTADTLRRMHALLRAQARVRAVRAVVFESPSYLRSKSSQHYHPPGPPTPEKLEHSVRTRSTGHDPPFMLKRSGSRSSGSKPILNQDRAPPYGYTSFDPRNIGSGGSSHRRGLYPKNFNFDDDKSDKILEVDTGKPYLPLKTRNAFCSSSRRAAGAAPSDLQSNSFSTSNQTVPSPSSFEVQSPSPLKIRDAYSIEDGDASFCTADNSPQFYSASSRGGSSRRSGGPFTPAKSDSGGGSRTSYLDGYPDHPNYMAYTESSRAKARSVSAPKQRPRYERLGSTKRYSRHGFAESNANKAYPGSGLLDRLGMPVQNVAVPSAGGFSY